MSFDSAKEASGDITTFLNMRFITTRKVALFQENITCYRAPSQEDFIEGTFCIDWYLVELEKVPAISNILCRF